MKVWKFFVVLPLLTAGLWAAAPGVNDLLLPEKIYPQLDAILRRTVQQSPRMVNAALELEAAENNRIAARASILPSIGGGYNYYQAWDDRADLNGRVNVAKVGYSFSINQSVFSWGERTNNARIGEIQKKMAEGSYQDGYRLLAQEIRTLYLQLIIKKLSLERARLSNRYNQDVLKTSLERYTKKVMSEAEIFPVRLNAERAQIDEERWVIDYESAKQSFARLTGSPALADSAIPDGVAPISYSAEPFGRLLTGFLAQKDPPTAAAINQRKQIEIANLSFLNQKTRLKPKLSLVVGVSQDEQSYNLNVAQKYRVNSLYGGVQVSWTIFDGFSAQAGTRNALIRLRQAENEYRDLTERLAIQAQMQVKQLDFAARSMSILDRLEVAAGGGFHVRQEDYARGIVSENDVTMAHLSYYNASIEAQNARIDYLLRVGDFLGTLVEDPVLANVADKQ